MQDGGSTPPSSTTNFDGADGNRLREKVDVTIRGFKHVDTSIRTHVRQNKRQRQRLCSSPRGLSRSWVVKIEIS